MPSRPENNETEKQGRFFEEQTWTTANAIVTRNKSTIQNWFKKIQFNIYSESETVKASESDWHCSVVILHATTQHADSQH